MRKRKRKKDRKSTAYSPGIRNIFPIIRVMIVYTFDAIQPIRLHKTMLDRLNEKRRSRYVEKSVVFTKRAENIEKTQFEREN